MGNIIEGISIHDLRIIPHPQGDIMHGIKSSDVGYSSFGEAYFSSVHHGEVKGWKMHTKMRLNLIVPIGEIKFVAYHEPKDTFFEIILSRSNYKRLSVEPGIWLAFQGVGQNENMLLNIASIPHDPTEAESKPLEAINYQWQ